MKKRVFIVLGIVILIVVVLGVITNYVDGGRVATGHEPKYCMKAISSDGSKVTYIGLGYKVVRYVGVSPSEPYENNVGVKMGSWFMKYNRPEVIPISIQYGDKTISVDKLEDINSLKNILVYSKYESPICDGISNYKVTIDGDEYFIKESCKEIQKGEYQASITKEDLETLLSIIESYK